MVRTVLYSAIGLVAAAGGPAAYFAAPGYWESVKEEWTPSDTVSGGAPVQEVTGKSGNAEVTPLPTGELADIPIHDITQVLRFDIDTAWVLNQWPRVSTGLAYLRLHGYRVPLVTGTTTSDLAGALTYYFNPGQQVQRITFQGLTGDPSILVSLLTTRYRFTRRWTNHPGLFVYEAVGPSNGRKSVLTIRPAHVVSAEAPHQRFHVDLVMERPS